ncbi:ABC transporter permease [Ruminococcaceae bacterium OttesenSCG-928-A16]|nr:ABC transporter permease [Ruminococcaceae bacterium OttesenSCG-928-A16]
MPNVMRFILKRLGMTLVILFCVSIIAFGLIRIAPGNPAMLVLPDGAPEEAIRAMEVKLGLDQPLPVQYFRYIGGVLKGDLGTSIIYKIPVKDLIFQRLPVTFQLTVITMVVCLLISIPLGIIAGSRQGTIIDFSATMFALLGQSMSTVWMGILVIYIFSVKLGWLPSMGYGTWQNFVLPAITLGYPVAAQVTRMGRSGMIDVLKEDYITATYAKGIGKAVVYTKYAFKNALIPIVTIVGMQIGTYLAGAVVVETIFAWPGFGQLIFQAVGTRDYPLVQSCLLVSAALFAIVNMFVDILNSFIDPRITLH